MTWRLLLAAATVIACATNGIAADLKVMSPVALRPIFEKIAPAFEQSTGYKLAISWGESGGVRADIEKGVAFDVAIMTAGFVDDLIKQQKLDGSTRTAIARSGIGLAIRKGARKPDIGTAEAFKNTLLAANSIGFVENSATSRYLGELLGRLGIAEAVKPKLRPLHGPAAEFVAKGDPEMAVTQISTIIPFAGVDYAGPLPQEIQRYTTFVGAMRPSASAEAKVLLKALVSAEAVSVLAPIGLAPAN
jgi:molybdate transport system substrate-binding protein